MRYRILMGWAAFGATSVFVVVQTTFLLIDGHQLIRPAVWDLSIAALIISGVATISLSAQDRIMRTLTRRIDLLERRAIMNAAHVNADEDADDDPRQTLRVVH